MSIKIKKASRYALFSRHVDLNPWSIPRTITRKA